MDEMQGIVAGLQQELRRGAIVLCVLALLKKPRYGYALAEKLEQDGLPIDPGTLYPLLRRLEKQGLLQSEWETSGPKPRKYYVRSADGEKVYQLLQSEWAQMDNTITKMTEGGK